MFLVGEGIWFCAPHQAQQKITKLNVNLFGQGMFKGKVYLWELLQKFTIIKTYLVESTGKLLIL